MLKQFDYHTNCVGKWHLGMEWSWNEKGKVDFNQPIQYGPNDVGFDHFFGIAASLDMVPYTFYENNKPVQPVSEIQPHLNFPRYIREGPKAKDFNPSEVLDRLTQEAVNYIIEQSNNENPFFLYFALTAPHKPVWPAERFAGKTGLGSYADFILQTDWTVGQVLTALQETGIKDNTLVIYTSDNGSFMFRLNDDKKKHINDKVHGGYHPDVHQANYIWRGTKADIWEAGRRVPFIARWPGKIKAGSKFSETICVTDIMATCADIVGYVLGEDEGEDSFSFLPVLLGKDLTRQRPSVVHHSSSGMFSLREGKWKMVFGNGSGGWQLPKGEPFAKPYFLFDLENDPTETTNMIDQYPVVAKRLSNRLEKIRNGKNSNLK